MAQKHKPGLAVIIGVGKPAGPKGPMPPRPGGANAPGPKAQEPDADDYGGAPDNDDDDQGGGAGEAGKATQDAAGFVPVWSLCGGCKNWTPATGACSKVQGSPFRPCDGCRVFFEPVGPTAGEEPMEGVGYPGQAPQGAAPQMGPSATGPQGQ